MLTEHIRKVALEYITFLQNIRNVKEDLKIVHERLLTHEDWTLLSLFKVKYNF